MELFRVKPTRSRTITTACTPSHTSRQQYLSPYSWQKTFNGDTTTNGFFPPNYKELYKQCKQELSQIKKKLQYTKIHELEAEIEEYRAEISRLTNLVKDGLRLNTQQSVPAANKMSCLEEDNIKLQKEIKQLKVENQKLARDQRILLTKIERTECLAEEDRMMQRRQLRSQGQTRPSYGQRSETQEKLNLQMRVRQKDNKIKNLEKLINQKSLFHSQADDFISDEQCDLSTIALKIKYQLIRKKVVLDDFLADLIQDNQIQEKITLFKVKQNFQRSYLYLENLSEKEREAFVVYLFNGQIVIKKEILHKRLETVIRKDYSDIFTNNYSRQKLEDSIKYTVEQIGLFKDELISKASSYPELSVQVFLKILYSTQLQLKPIQREYYEYALMDLSYPYFKGFSYSQAINPFTKQFLDNLFYQIQQ